MAFARKPGFYGSLVALALLANAAGYLLNLWHDETVFDEAVHLFTSFAVIGLVGATRTKGRDTAAGLSFALKLVALGIALGLAWEGFEWLIGIVGGTRDTLMDLTMDAVGSALAALLLTSASEPNRRARASH